jgi:DNA processing protein
MDLNDPPMLLFYRGRLPDPVAKTVTVSGTRRASQRGQELTSRLAKIFATAGVQIVSTLGDGIDAAAHLGARAANGRSFAVTDVGFDSPILADKMPLAIDIVSEGGVISECAPDEEPDAESFRDTNRIVVALSQAVVVTEFYESSERTLDLLDCCAEIGKIAFVMIDDRWGALSDKTGLQRALDNGAIPMTGWDKVDGIIQSLV